MREPALRFRHSLLNGPAFFTRIRENLQSVWKLPSAALPAAHAPIHLLDERRAPIAPAAQLWSTFLHVFVCAALLWLAVHPPKQVDSAPGQKPSFGPLAFEPLKWMRNSESGDLGKHGSSGGHNQLPPTLGELAPPSQSLVISLHLADSRPHILNVPIAVHAADAPDIVSTITDPGLPWMKDRNSSEGLGENGIGKGKDHGMGDGPGDGSGIADEPGPFGSVATPVFCKVCPEPLYSDEARKVKMQGSVTLSVLVGADGRAKEVRVVRGTGMGLDENAIQAVRAWQFIPAKDAAHRPIASWVQVETTFRLF